MTVWLTLALSLLIVATSFLSGLFGMAGGLILIGVLLAVAPVPTAMVLHAITQIASNGWRGLLWQKHVHWPVVATYVSGCALAVLTWSMIQYIPSKPAALLLLGVTPFLVLLVPAGLKPNSESPAQGVLYGSICMTLMLLSGVAGPLMDMYFLGGTLDRRQIVATKAVCQILGHSLKLAYFGGIISEAALLDPLLCALAIIATLIGTVLAQPLLLAMSDKQYRVWAGRLIMTVSTYYVLHGAFLLQ